MSDLNAILLVDADSGARDRLHQLLESDYSVEIAATAAEALDRENWSDFFAIVLDRQLPDDLDGNLLPQLRRQAPDAGIVIVTEVGDLDDAIAAIRQGAADYLLKPIDPKAIRSVLTLLAERAKTRRQLEEMARLSSAIVDTVSHPLVVLNPGLQVQYANQAFHQTFQTSPEETENRRFSELANQQWDRPDLRRLLAEVFSRNAAFQGYEVHGDFPGIGRRVMQLSARLISNSESEMQTLLLAIEDITERKQAEEQVRAYQKRLQRLASKLTLTEEHERQRIAADLHDRIGQALSVLQIKAGILRTSSSPEQREGLDELYQLIDRTVRDTRSLTFEISPPVLYELGLEAAIEWLAERFRELYEVEIAIADDGQPKPLNEDMRSLLFRSVRELLLNVSKHAQTDRARVSLDRGRDSIRIEVRDQGRGFDPAQCDSEEISAESFGLFSIRERMDSLDGSFQVESSPGRGTRCVLVAPLMHQKE